jgi:hypothetical protein
VTSALRVAAGLACLGVIAASCSSSPKPTVHHSATTTTANESAGTTTTSSSVPATTTSTAASSTGSTTCTSFSASVGQSEGAAGTITGTINIIDTGGAPCTMEGYPALALFGSGGTALPVTIVDGLTVNISSAANGPPTQITVSPSQGADFTYQYSDVITGNETSCPSSVTVSVKPPGTSTTAAPIPLVMDPCDNGTIRVSPVYPGG